MGGKKILLLFLSYGRVVQAHSNHNIVFYIVRYDSYRFVNSFTDIIGHVARACTLNIVFSVIGCVMLLW